MQSQIGPSPERAADEAPARAKADVRCFLALLLVVLFLGTLVTAGWLGRWTTWHTQPPDRARLLAGINPNVAEWYEIAQLPGIGESLGRRIVEYRRSQRATGGETQTFHAPGDLARVKGIGRKTVQRLTPLLRFEN